MYFRRKTIGCTSRLFRYCSVTHPDTAPRQAGFQRSLRQELLFCVDRGIVGFLVGVQLAGVVALF